MIAIKKIIAATIISASLLVFLSLIIPDSEVDIKTIQPAWDVVELIDAPVETTGNVDGVVWTIKNN